MKLAFFNDYKLGVVKGDTIVDVSAVVRDIPHLGPHDLINGLIARFSDYRKRLEDASASGGVPLSGVKLQAPLPKPGNIVCMAVNYMENGTRKEPAPINAFHKAPTAILGPGGTMVLPDVPATIFEGEAEMALVIGKRASHVKAADAMDYVFGYTNFIDGSARGIPPTSFFAMKSRDSFAPIGPYLVTKDEIADPHKVPVKLWNNGTLMQDFNTDDMAHKNSALHRVGDLDPRAGARRHPRHRYQPPRPQRLHGRRHGRAGVRRSRQAQLQGTRRPEAHLVARDAAGPAEPGVRHADAADRRQVRAGEVTGSLAEALCGLRHRGAGRLFLLGPAVLANRTHER